MGRTAARQAAAAFAAAKSRATAPANRARAAARRGEPATTSPVLPSSIGAGMACDTRPSAMSRSH